MRHLPLLKRNHHATKNPRSRSPRFRKTNTEHCRSCPWIDREHGSLAVVIHGKASNRRLVISGTCKIPVRRNPSVLSIQNRLVSCRLANTSQQTKQRANSNDVYSSWNQLWWLTLFLIICEWRILGAPVAKDISVLVPSSYSRSSTWGTFGISTLLHSMSDPRVDMSYIAQKIWALGIQIGHSVLKTYPWSKVWLYNIRTR